MREREGGGEKKFHCGSVGRSELFEERKESITHWTNLFPFFFLQRSLLFVLLLAAAAAAEPQHNGGGTFAGGRLRTRARIPIR